MPEAISGPGGRAVTGSPSGVLLAFDFGSRRIGVAIGNTLTATARALAVIAAEPVATRFNRIAELIRTWQPVQLVVGYPLQGDGSPGPTTLKCERFARQLEGRFRLPVALVDERYSSVAADAGDPGDDAEAAATILRQYLSEA